MRVALIAPDWGNAWIPMIKAEVESRGHEFQIINPAIFKEPEVFDLDYAADAHIHAWAVDYVVPGRRNVMFLRRYELFDGCLSKVRWNYVSDLIVVNSWIKDRVDEYFKAKGIQTKTHLIYNAVDLSKWTFKERKPNHRIGMACHIHPKKNLPLAVEVLAHLPEHFELHIAGAVQDGATLEYINHIAKLNRRKVYVYRHIPREHLNSWWEQMGFCLSTSISEGNPNNVIEAMAKGIKPIVLSWPGAAEQFFEGWIGNNARELADLICEYDPESQTRHIFAGYLSHEYRQWVQEWHSLDNIRRAVDIALNQPTQE